MSSLNSQKEWGEHPSELLLEQQQKFTETNAGE